MIGTLTDCPECRSAGAIRGNICEVCLAELDERPDLREPSPQRPPARALPADESAGAFPPADSPLRFTDVIAELAAIGDLAERSGIPGAAETAAKVTALLERLRRQFLAHIAS